MTDPRSQKPVTILPGDRGGGLFQVPTSRVDEVHAVFDRHNVPYWDGPVDVSIDGRPPIRMVHLSVKADLKLAQQLLDSLP